MEDIRLNTTGKILEGTHVGWYVEVVDDAENTGGYLIFMYESLAPGVGQGFDAWAENWASVEGYFRESNWKITWMEG